MEIQNSFSFRLISKFEHVLKFSGVTEGSAEHGFPKLNTYVKRLLETDVTIF